MEDREDWLTADPKERDEAYPMDVVPCPFESNGVTVPGTFYLAAGAGPHPTALLLHGFPGYERNLDLAHALCRGGVNVLYFHYRGSWGTGGSFSLSHCAEDVRAARRFLLEPGAPWAHRIDTDRLFPVGHSMGGFLSLLVGSEPDLFPAAAGITPANFGVLGRRAREDAAFRASYLGFIEDKLLPLHGTDAPTLLREIMDNADAWDLVERARGAREGAFFLCGGRRDEICPFAGHHEPLAAALLANPEVALEEHVFDDGHTLIHSRVGLARLLVSWVCDGIAWQ
ncbi:MAG: alpha/beta fold hydrolase [Synergistales bacterium]|nr:alpha/beta fold hydrolase [Synergistales bacterium]